MIKNKTIQTAKSQYGFTLIELLIIVAILGILAAIAYPSYIGYIEKGHRADTMNEMQNIASQIQARKLAQGSYSNALKTGLGGAYPRDNNAVYTIAITPDPLTDKWTITATPITGTRMAGDGNLTLNYRGIKCRATACGTGEEWR